MADDDLWIFSPKMLEQLNLRRELPPAILSNRA